MTAAIDGEASCQPALGFRGSHLNFSNLVRAGLRALLGVLTPFLWALLFRLSTVVLPRRDSALSRAVGPGAFALAAAALRGIAFLKCAGIRDEDLSINDEDE